MKTRRVITNGSRPKLLRERVLGRESKVTDDRTIITPVNELEDGTGVPAFALRGPRRCVVYGTPARVALASRDRHIELR